MVKSLRRAFLVGAGGAPEVRLLSTYVSGTAYWGAAEAARELRTGDELLLRRAPDNPYDARAVEVRTPGGAKLGYVPRIDNQALANLMDAGFQPTARVRAVVPDGLRPEIRFDVAFAIQA